MATKVHMEALSPTMEEGRLVKWTKREGEAVKTGDTLAEVETDKAVMELVARADGQFLHVIVAEGTLTLITWPSPRTTTSITSLRSEEHTSQLQSLSDLVCRPLLVQ